MKHNLKRMWRSGTAMLLALCLVVGLCPAVAFAQTEEINYVSLGDSMTNGYCFDGYEQGSDTLDFFSGDGVYGDAAYPNQFATWLKSQGYKVNHTKLAPSAMRAEDLNYLLGGRAMPNDGWYGEVNDYTNCRDNDELSKFFQDEVAKADLITMCVGNASFGAYMLHRVTSALGIFGATVDDNEKVNLDMALAELEPEQKQVVMQAYNQMKAELANYIPAELAEEYNVDYICDLVAYTTAGFLLNYKGSLERIVELNPDAEIILIGLMNTTYGMTITVEGMDPLPVGDIMDGVFGLLNAYIAGLPTVMQATGEFSEAKFYYAEQPNPLFISQQFAALKKENWGVVDGLDGATVRERNIKAYNGALREMISQAFANVLNGQKLPETNIEAVKKVEQGQTTGDDFLNMSTAIYLGIEDAVAASTDTMEIPLTGLEKIAGDLSGVFKNADLDVTNIRESLGKYLTSTPELKGMCKIYALFKVGNGMSVHPTPAGHNQIAASVINAYKTNHTAKDETVENVTIAMDELHKLLEEYGPEILEGAYSYAEENGYIEALETAVTELKAELEAKTEEYLNEAKPEIEARIAELEAQLKALEEELASLKAQLEEKKAELEGLYNETAEDVTAAIEALEAMIAEIEAAIETVETAIAEVQAAVEELVGILAEIETELENLVEAVETMDEALNALFDAVTNAGEGSVDAAVKAFDAAREAALTAVEAVNTIYNTVAEALAEIEGLTETIAEAVDNAYEFVAEKLTALAAAVDALPEEVKAVLEAASAEIKDAAEKAAEEVWAKANEEIAALESQISGLKAQLENAAAGTAAEIEAKITELETQIADLKTQLENAAEEAKAEIETKIAELEAQVADLKAQLENAAEEAKTEIEAKIAELEAKIEEIKAAAQAEAEKLITEAEGKAAELIEAIDEELQAVLEQIETELKAAVEAAVEVVEEKLADAIVELTETVDELVADLTAVAEEKVTEIVDAFNAAYVDATTGDYAVTEDSYYVAIGDSSAVSKSYVDGLAAELGVDYTNLAKDGLTIDGTAAVLAENAATIAKADLITVGYTNNTFTDHAAAQIKAALTGGTPADVDWSTYLNADGIALVEDMLADLNAEFVAAGMDVALGTSQYTIADLMTLVVEGYAYDYVSFACTYPEIINAIHEINPEALVILVGMYNPLDGVALTYGDSEIAVGEYMQYLVDLTNLHYTAYAMLTPDTIFVDAPAVETGLPAGEYAVDMFLMDIMFNGTGKLLPNENGDTYIKNQILKALNITVVEEEPAGLWGDANNDGKVTPVDAAMILRYDAGLLDASRINLRNSDVNGDGKVTPVDAAMILRYDAGLLAK